ncbi:cytochrome p450 domain-containing protein [Sarocladium implicatum]|nr:cytochrome p450 domain-containing protein [Sarocladium implicatum]
MDFGLAPIKKILAGSLLLAPALVGLESKAKLTGIVVGLFSSGLCAWVAWKVFVYPHLLSPFRDLPTPPGASWWNGHAEILRKAQIRTVPNDGLIRFREGLNAERILVTSPQALHELQVVRTYDFEKPAILRFLMSRVIGNGLLATEGDDHKFQRRALTPGFTPKQIRAVYPKLWLKACESSRVLAQEAEALRKEEGKAINLNDWSSRVTLDAAGVSVMGRDFGAVSDPGNPLIKLYGLVFAPGASDFNIIAMSLPQWIGPYLPLSAKSALLEGATTIRQFARDLIHTKRERIANGEEGDHDILEVLLGTELNEDQLIDQTMTFLTAGYETTATQLMWTIYMLATHQDVQDKLREEIRAQVGTMKEREDVTSEVIEEKMPYLQAVISESARYFPAVPGALRQAVVDTSLLSHPFPAGSVATVAMGAINRDPSLWGPSADEFRPERWLEDSDLGTAQNGGASSKYAYMTFFHGQRRCIGEGFTRAKLGSIVAAWVGGLRFEVRGERYLGRMRFKRGHVSLQPVEGPFVDVTVVDGW